MALALSTPQHKRWGFDSATSALHTTAGALKQMCDTCTLAECHYKNYHA